MHVAFFWAMTRKITRATDEGANVSLHDRPTPICIDSNPVRRILSLISLGHPGDAAVPELQSN
jgi:hypothetical protein